MDDEAALAEIRRAAQEALYVWLEARAAVLYGSRARGNHRPDSDRDVAFIVRGDGERLGSVHSGVPFSVPGVRCRQHVNEIAIPERLVARKALDGAHGAARDSHGQIPRMVRHCGAACKHARRSGPSRRHSIALRGVRDSVCA